MTMYQTNMTYAQFEDAAKRAGLLGQFSEWDLNLAKQNPEAGMEILNYKVDYGKATTDEGRALAQSGAEGVRKRYGYSGGETGGSFVPTSGKSTGSLYSFDDVKKRQQESGVSMSDYDWDLAEKNPMAGMGIVENKIGYGKATTPEEEAKFNAGNETIRRDYGGYTGGADGSGFMPAPLSPDDYVAPDAPKYAGNRMADVEAAAKKVKEYAPFSYDVEKPTFDSKYTGMGEELISEILNREEFSYNAENDPLYSQFKKQYLREGERASQDAIGVAAAATGGIPSSYAVQAAAQAGNYYAAQLTDKIPELYQMAYNQYLNENQMKHSALDAVRGMEEFDYTKHRDDMNQWNADRNFAYGVHNDEYGRLLDAFDIAAKLEGTDYSRYLDNLDQHNKDKEFDYGVHLDEIGYRQGEEEKAYNREQAEKAYTDERGDVDFDKWYMTEQLKANNTNAALAEKELAANLGNAEWERKYKLAQLAKSEGNTATYNALMAELMGGSYTPISGFKSGSSSGDGRSSEGRESTSDDTGDETEPQYDFTLLKELYPSGAIPSQEVWKSILDTLEISEEELKKAGFVNVGETMGKIANSKAGQSIKLK